jgi:hypothetical protein
MTNFTKWLDTMIDEKGIDAEDTFSVDGASGINIIPIGCVIEAIKTAPAGEQAAIKDMMVKIDFHNASITDYLRHLAGALAA